ncbi:MAG: Bacterial polymerase, alpha chain terminal domain [Euryarchaeota archaeon]|nr:Bacterial polymerase, alpha chain terminal domain [Euryarchaeota archaeon]
MDKEEIYRLFEIYGNPGSDETERKESAIKEIQPIAKKILTKTEYKVLSFRLGLDNRSILSNSDIARLEDCTYSHIRVVEEKAFNKLKGYKCMENLWKEKGKDLESCLSEYAPRRDLSEIGKDAYVFLQLGLKKLGEKYGQEGVADDVLELLKQAYTLDDLYKGNLVKRQVPIGDTNLLSTHAVNVLHAAGVERVIDIADFSEEQILKLRGSGKQVLKNVKSLLSEIGLKLKD